MYKEERPWGTFENLLEAEYCKVKRITVYPGQRLSYQYHFKRSEVWTVVVGNPLVTIEGILPRYKPGDTIIIPAETQHRIQNATDQPVIFIEVQYGEYFGEDDIVRINDDYDRS